MRCTVQDRLRPVRTPRTLRGSSTPAGAHGGRTGGKLLDAMHNCTYNQIMQYQWDTHKAAVNLRKHGIEFADSVAVFEDDFTLVLADDYPDEERFVVIGQDAFGRVLVVVFTYRGEQTIRIISARRATVRERRQYEVSR